MKFRGRFQRSLYFALGMVSLGLGILGIFLPLLPTTPFLLLASYFFIRSSPSWHTALVNHPVLGRFLRDWERHGGVRRSVKILAVGMVLITVGISIYSDRLGAVSQAILVALATIGLFVVYRLPVVSQEAAKPSEAPPTSVARSSGGGSESAENQTWAA